MSTPQVLRANELGRRARELGTTVWHVIRLDAAAELARQGDARKESDARGA